MVGSVEGRFYEAGSSRSIGATLTVHAFEEIEIRFDGRVEAYSKGDYVVEPPLGSLKRVVHFKAEGGDSRFETDDQAGFREMESHFSSGGVWRRIAWLEGHWKGTVASLLMIGFFCFAFLQWGLPALAWKVAMDMPQSWRQSMTEQSIAMMERMNYVDESSIDIDEHVRIQEIFYEALDLSGADVESFDYELRVFGGKAMGANAFAFPSGLVVATDEFVDLCETDKQVLAVFLHEVTHVEKQHGIRALVQRGGVFLVFSILIGDASSAISLAEGIPALVLNSQYSQRFELESDTFAAKALEEADIGADAMKEILILLHRDVPDIPVATFLSTHPSLQERVDNIERIESGLD
ncbi:peptidase, M48 family [Verrucomicrobiia bacterium DG1235]|nr:peptidase, M48 family [Verrucomicrobiae bacterium DG1235]